MLPIVINILLVIHVLVSLLIILIVLMQRPKTEGLGAAFGGGMTENLFGAQTTNVLQTITRWLGGMFFALTLALSILYVRQSGSRSAVQERLSNAPVPATPAAPIPTVPAPPPTAGEPPSLDGKEPVIVLPVAKPGEAASGAVQAPLLPVPELPKEPLPPVPGVTEKPLVPPPANTPSVEKEKDAALSSTGQPSAPKKSDPAAPAPESQERKDAPAQKKESGNAADPKPSEPPK